MSTYSVAEDDKLNVITPFEAYKNFQQQMQWIARILYLIFNIFCAAE